MKIEVILEKCEEGGYTASVPFLPGCISEGDTVEEAIALYLRAVSKENHQLTEAKEKIIVE